MKKFLIGVYMDIEKFIEILDADFYTGVPDSQLRALCDYLMDKYGVNRKNHVIAANEGNCVGIAAGYHLATGKVPVVYMQNSGEGNVINPVASLLNEKVYAIPMIFIIGWRGEPGIHDEPQHIYQGEITLQLLKDMGIEYFIVDTESSFEDIAIAMRSFRQKLSHGKNVAFVVRKNAFFYHKNTKYKNNNTLIREDVIKHIVNVSKEDPIISTTGKISRELFEIREENHQSHKYDFLTVGSMGHASSIALGIALNKPKYKIWCIDGDGALLMHMGAMPIVGTSKVKNLIHIVMNNAAHETVGGMPTVMGQIGLSDMAKACGYETVFTVCNAEMLEKALLKAKNCNSLTFIEIKCAIESRKDLGRPTTKPIDNKINFMEYIMA